MLQVYYCSPRLFFFCMLVRVIMTMTRIWILIMTCADRPYRGFYHTYTHSRVHIYIFVCLCIYIISNAMFFFPSPPPSVHKCVKYYKLLTFIYEKTNATEILITIIKKFFYVLVISNLNENSSKKKNSLQNRKCLRAQKISVHFQLICSLSSWFVFFKKKNKLCVSRSISRSIGRQTSDRFCKRNKKKEQSGDSTLFYSLWNPVCDRTTTKKMELLSFENIYIPVYIYYV